jgi:hypothetical protein
MPFKATPVLGANYWFKPRAVMEMFDTASAGLPPEIAEFVGHKLREHPDFRARRLGGASS